MAGSSPLFVRRGGAGAPALLLLHGLGATGAVWDAVVASESGWRLALDPRAFAVGAPDMAGMLGCCRAAGVPVVLAAGEHDPMSPVEHLQALVPEPLSLKGLGHNAHVEDATAVLPVLDRLADSTLR